MDASSRMTNILTKDTAIKHLIEKGFIYDEIDSYYYEDKPSVYMLKKDITNIILYVLKNNRLKNIHSNLLTYKEWFSHFNCDTTEKEFVNLFELKLENTKN